MAVTNSVYYYDVLYGIVQIPPNILCSTIPKELVVKLANTTQTQHVLHFCLSKTMYFLSKQNNYKSKFKYLSVLNYLH